MCPLSRVIHPEQLVRVGFVYTGEGTFVQCFQCAWRLAEGDVPLDVHQPYCLFLKTLTSGSNSSKPGEQAAPQSSTQSLATDGSTGQLHVQE